MRHAACRLGLTLLATLVVAAPATAAAPERAGVHLGPGAFKRVGAKIVCGRVDGRWQAGARWLSFWFVSHAQRAKSLRRAGRTAAARRFARRAAAQSPACRPLRFDLRHAVGLAVHGPVRPRAGDLSNLDVLRRDGAVRDAVTAGAANVKRIFTAPAGKVYVLFIGQTAIGGGEPLPNTENLPVCDEEDFGAGEEETELRAGADDEEDAPEEECFDSTQTTPVDYCLIAELDPASREPTCIDSGLYAIRESTFRGVNEAVQFDAQGAVYYLGNGSMAHGYASAVLRRYLDGKTTEFISDRNVLIDDFLVLPSGDVLVTGANLSNGARWLRRIEPTGRVHSIWSRSASFLRLFPDGNAYAGHDTGGGAPGVARFLTATNTMEPGAWMDGSTVAEACAGADQAAVDAFCAPAGSRMSESLTTPDGRVYAVAGTPDGGRLVQYFPEVRIPASGVRKVSVAEILGDAVVLAGADAQEHRVLVLHDTKTDAETTLIGPDAELDVYHLAYDDKTGKLRFDGLRFADNRYVLGEIDLATGAVSYPETSATQWTDLEALG